MKHKKQLNTLILEPHKYSQKALSIYKSFGPVSCVSNINKHPTPTQKKLFAKTNILVVRNMVHLDKAFIDLFPNLKILGVGMTGLNHIDTAYLKKKGVVLFSVKGQTKLLKNVPAVAEKTIGFIISLSHQLTSGFESVKKGNWQYKDYIGNQIEGKTIGLIGFGRLGTIVARHAKAFRMNIIATDPNVTRAEMKKKGVTKVSLTTLLKKSDFVSMHASYTLANTDLLKEKHFKQMKRGALYINTARGELNNEKALLKALTSKHIAGAALDVMKNEHRNGTHLKKNPLITYAKKHNNLLIIPHTGGFVWEGLEKVENFVAEAIQKHLR